jgi:hypothetical protein
VSVEFVEVTTQAELDKAVAAGNIAICRAGFFVASGSASVRAYGSASVEAYGSASVRAYGSASVEASGSASVRAYGSASVRAYGSASVEAYGSASVEAYGSASVQAYDSASVQATNYVAVQRHPDRGYGHPTVKGGVLIDIPAIKTPQDFCDFYGLKPTRGSVVLYKGVSDDFKSRHGASYQPGKSTMCADWSKEPCCGNGLHFSPRPWMARKYAPDCTRFVACRVKLTEVVVIVDYGTADKVKAPSCRVLFECDEDGQEIKADAAVAA